MRPPHLTGPAAAARRARLDQAAALSTFAPDLPAAPPAVDSGEPVVQLEANLFRAAAGGMLVNLCKRGGVRERLGRNAVFRVAAAANVALGPGTTSLRLVVQYLRGRAAMAGERGWHQALAQVCSSSAREGCPLPATTP